MGNLLAAAALAAAMPSAPQASQPPEPALFVVRDADTTIYIFGTFHALDARSKWFGERIHDAFEQSSELVLETLIPETPSPLPAATAGQRPLSITPSASFLATTRMAINAGRAPPCCPIDAPSRIGNTGSVQGAAMVTTPASSASRRSGIGVRRKEGSRPG